MRIDVKKWLFLGTEDEKESFFKAAQLEGLIHFIDPKASSQKEVSTEVQDTLSAIKVLRHLPPVEQEENLRIVNLELLVSTLLNLNQENEKRLEELRVLKLEIARMEIYGDFSKEDIEYIEREGHCKLQFFCARPSLFLDEPPPAELIYIAYEHGLDYYVAINPQPIAYEKMVEIKIEHPSGELKRRYIDLEKAQHGVEQELKKYAKYNDLLHRFLIMQLNQFRLYTAQTYVQEAMGGDLFTVEGWVPASKADQVSALVDSMHVYAEEVAIEPTDIVPTYLENKGFRRVGEDLVDIYDTPSQTDKDPSMWVLGSFALFFAIIIGDAGYGLVYLALALFLRYKYPSLKATTKRALNLFTLLSIGCVIWGTLMTSFFGMQIAPDNPLRRLSLLQWLGEKKAAYHLVHQDATYQELIREYSSLVHIRHPHEFLLYTPLEAQDQLPPILGDFSNTILFELALFIGVMHIILSLLRYIRRNWVGAGWIAFLIGSYLYFANYLRAPSLLNFVGGIDLAEGGRIGLQLLVAGLAFALIGSVIRQGLTGIFDVFMTLIQVFADTLSYLRLYALGLAGAIVGATINEVAVAVPLLFGIILVVLSHVINITLGTMSGVIHGLRLNFIEGYHYSFEGGGKKFQPLKLIKKD